MRGSPMDKKYAAQASLVRMIVSVLAFACDCVAAVLTRSPASTVSGYRLCRVEAHRRFEWRLLKATYRANHLIDLESSELRPSLISSRPRKNPIELFKERIVFVSTAVRLMVLQITSISLVWPNQC
jgi:hypothetical protein